MDLFDYIAQMKPRTVTSDEGLYQRQESQAGFSLPVIHRPFDAANAWHWKDRGHVLDFRCVVGGGDLLDVGPGDGWPSLLVAPFARTVTGVDAAERRVCACVENANRLGLTNFMGVHVTAGERLPFPDNFFDGIMAAHSIEQTPDPKATLLELYRVLKPGGRLRLLYEGLAQYRGGRDREFWAWENGEGVSQLLFCHRRIEEEQAVYYALQCDAPLDQVEDLITGGGKMNAHTTTVEGLERIRPLVTDVARWTLVQPCCRTWLDWLGEIGFTSATTTHEGSRVARRIFDQIASADRPANIAGVDRLLHPAVAVVVELEAPTHLDGPITAVK